jgi:hypothetical protein
VIARWSTPCPRAIFISTNIIDMNFLETQKDHAVRALSSQEMRAISGGWSLTGFLVDLAKAGSIYFFNMGLREGRRMKAQL